MNTRTTATRFGIVFAAAALVLTGCSPASDSATAPASTATAPTSEHSTAAETTALTITDAWTKAAESGMSAAFGVLQNNSENDITIVSATTDASPMVELHETVASATGEMMMQQIDGGFVIPAGEALTLEPGGNHIMLMGLTAPIVAGETVSFTLELADGETVAFDAPVKDFAGANETYEDGEHDTEETAH